MDLGRHARPILDFLVHVAHPAVDVVQRAGPLLRRNARLEDRDALDVLRCNLPSQLLELRRLLNRRSRCSYRTGDRCFARFTAAFDTRLRWVSTSKIVWCARGHPAPCKMAPARV